MKIISYLGLSIIIILNLCLISCTNKVRDEYSLGNLKSNNPYKGDETLIFIDADSNTLILNGAGRISKYLEQPAGINTNKVDLFEIDDTKFYSPGYNYCINIHMKAACCLQDNMGIYFMSGYQATNNSYNYNAGFGFPLPVYASPTTSHIDFLTTMNVHGKTFQNVFINTCINYNYPVPFPLKMYYTVKEGIIRLDFSDGKIMELKN